MLVWINRHIESIAWDEGVLEYAKWQKDRRTREDGSMKKDEKESER